MAVCSDNTEVVRLLIEAGADINAQDGDRWTCLCWVKSLEMATFLLAHGADPSIPTWRTIGELGPFPEDCESIPEAARDLMRAHRLKAPQSQDHALPDAPLRKETAKAYGTFPGEKSVRP